MAVSPPVSSSSEELVQKGRGQRTFATMPPFGVALYDRLMADSPLQTHYADIAQDLAGRISQGRLLDVGTGPGRLLLAFHSLCPHVELFGLDISPAMLGRARQNLAGIPANLQLGTIVHTGYPDGLFDLVVSTGSFYVWDEPEQGLDEIHRILKSGQAAYLYECRRDIDRQAFRVALRENLRSAKMLSKLFGPWALRKALSMSYNREEMAAIVARTRFAGSSTIGDIAPAGMPIWVRMELRKGESHSTGI